MKVFKTTVSITVNTDSCGEACDCLTAILTESMRKYCGQSSALIDWEYNETWAEGSLPDDYEAD